MLLLLWLIGLFTLDLVSTGKVPTAANIEEYDDAMLDEIFAETNSNPLQGQQTNSAPANVRSPNPGVGVDLLQQQVEGHLQRMDSSPPAAVVDGAKNVIDPNAKPPPGAVFSNPVVNKFPSVIGRPEPSSFGANAGGLDQSVGNSAFAGTLTDLAFQAGQTFYSGVRQASRLFGVDAGQYQPYEVPLVSQGARFFGRR